MANRARQATATDASAIAPSEPVPDSPSIRQLLHRAGKRVRLLRARRTGASGMLIGVGISLSLLVALRMELPIGDWLAEEWLLLPPLVGLATGAVWGATRAVPSLPLLRLLEQSFDLKERLSTAYCFQPASDPILNAFAERQRTDADTAAATVGALNRLLPFWPPHRRETAAVVACLGTALLSFLPNLPAFQSPAERIERQSVRKEGERIVQVARLLEKRATERKQETARQAAQKMAKLGDEMKRGRLTRQKALMKTARLSEEMRKAQMTAASQSAPRSLPGAARELGKALANATNGSSGSKDPETNALNAPQNSAGQKQTPGKSAQANADTLKQMQQAMAQNNVPSLAEQLSKLADRIALGRLQDKAGRADLAAKLEALANALGDTTLKTASDPLREAANALRSDNQTRAAEKLREAARRAAESARQGEEAQTMQQMADALSGKENASGEGEMSDAGEGVGQDDAFGKDGTRKGAHIHTKECLQPGGT